MISDKMIAQQLTKRYGPVIDLNANPGVMMEIVQQVGSIYGSEPGTPEPTTRPGRGVTNEEIMKEVLKLARSVSALGGVRGATRSATRGKTASTRSASAKRKAR
jgi:hypothetical protein